MSRHSPSLPTLPSLSTLNDEREISYPVGKVTVEIGRIMLAAIFILSGITKLNEWTVALNYLSSKGVPFAGILIGLSIVIEIVGGISILFGYYGAIFGSLLFLYLIPVTLTMHNFWAYSGMEHQTQLVHFLKNMAIMGGLIQYCMYQSITEKEKQKTLLDTMHVPLKEHRTQ